MIIVADTLTGPITNFCCGVSASNFQMKHVSVICCVQSFLISNQFWTRSKHLFLIYVVFDV